MICRRKWVALAGVSVVAVMAASSAAWSQVDNPAAGTTTTQGANAITDNTGYQGSAAINGTVSGVLVTGVNATNGGTMILNNTSNSFSGGVYVSGGSTLSFDTAAELGSGAGVINLGGSSPGSTGILSVNSAATVSVALTQNVLLNAGGAILSTTNPLYPLIFQGSVGTASTITTASPTPILTITGPGTVVELGTLAANTFVGNVLATNGATIGLGSDDGMGANVTTTTALNGLLSTSSTPLPNVLTLDNATLQFEGSFTLLHQIDITGNNGAGGTGYAATFDTNGNNATLADSLIVDPAAKVSKIGAGSLILEGTSNTVGGGIWVSAASGTTGYLQVGDPSSLQAKLTSNVTLLPGGGLSGYGTIVGNVLNSAGMVMPGGVPTLGSDAFGTLTINGNFTQAGAGTTSVSLAPNGSSSLTVNGSANLAGTFQVAYGNGFLRPGTYQLFSVSGPTTGAFNSIVSQVPSVGLTQTISDTMTSQGGQVIDVTLTQKTSLPQYPTIVPAMTSAAIEEAQAWTGAILNHMSDERLGAYADNMSVANSTYHRTRTVSPYGYWFSPLGDSGTVSGNNGAPGAKTQKYGFVTGIDDELLRGVMGGIAIGVDRVNVAEQGTAGGSGHIDTPHLDFYGSWWRGPFAIDATAGIAVAQVDTARPVLGTNAGAYGSYGASEMSTGLQANYAGRFDDWAYTAGAGAKFVHFVQTGFTETGATDANFAVDHRMSNSMRPYVEAAVSRRIEIGQVTALIPQVHVAYEQEVMSGIHLVNTMTQGDYYNWMVRGVMQGKGALTASASVVVETSKDQAYYMTYDRYQSSTITDQTISAGLRLRM